MGEHPNKMENVGLEIKKRISVMWRIRKELLYVGGQSSTIQLVDCSEQGYAICALPLQVFMHIEAQFTTLKYFIFNLFFVFTSCTLPLNLQF